MEAWLVTLLLRRVRLRVFPCLASRMNWVRVRCGMSQMMRGGMMRCRLMYWVMLLSIASGMPGMVLGGVMRCRVRYVRLCVLVSSAATQRDGMMDCAWSMRMRRMLPITRRVRRVGRMMLRVMPITCGMMLRIMPTSCRMVWVGMMLRFMLVSHDWSMAGRNVYLVAVWVRVGHHWTRPCEDVRVMSGRMCLLVMVGRMRSVVVRTMMSYLGPMTGCNMDMRAVVSRSRLEEGGFIIFVVFVIVEVWLESLSCNMAS